MSTNNKENAVGGSRFRSTSTKAKPMAFGAGTGGIGSAPPIAPTNAATATAQPRYKEQRYDSPAQASTSTATDPKDSVTLGSISQEVRALKSLLVQNRERSPRKASDTAEPTEAASSELKEEILVGTQQQLESQTTALLDRLNTEHDKTTQSVVNTVSSIQHNFEGQFAKLLTAMEQQSAAQLQQQAETQAKLAEVYEERTELQVTVAQLQAAAKGRKEAQVAEMEHVKEEVSGLQDLAVLAKKKLGKVQAELEISEEEKQVLEEKVAELKKKNVQHREEGSKCAADLEELHAEHQRLRDERDNFKQQLHSSQREATDFKRDAMEVRMQMDDLSKQLLESEAKGKTDYLRLAETNNKLESKAEEAWALVASQEGEVQELKTRIHQLQGELAHQQAAADAVTSPQSQGFSCHASINAMRRASVSPPPAHKDPSGPTPTLSFEERRRQKKQKQQQLQLQQSDESGSFSRSASASSMF